MIGKAISEINMVKGQDIEIGRVEGGWATKKFWKLKKIFLVPKRLKE